ncbi:type III pantothenate kinase [Desulfuromonas versatilis]|uniref:Type III pantothenate kinase n=1 Tax=Desulfuromonas versatilis TaxID=2802975 RepID=A0ABM8HVG1_9BACT|nr:type III pantothenate kinase [Desulfuromonas versatilis]BCR04508.1 type III pantothenate kinase [Desulfuromonas versatilis]
MLLVIDVGNTNTVLGMYDDTRLVRHWRLTTDKSRTVDEYAILIGQLFHLADIRFADIRDVVISCVVPPVLNTFENLCRSYFQKKPYIVGPGIKTGMPILYDNPREVGADRIVNAVAAYEKYRRALIIVDFGTATTFDFISAKGEYLGGAIAPGVAISAEALFERASKLPRVELARPPQIIAKNTVNSMQAGIFFGYVGLVEGIVARMKQESGENPLVVATGGLAPLISSATQVIEEVEPLLTLDGLLIIYGRNKTAVDSSSPR